MRKISPPERGVNFLNESVILKSLGKVSENQDHGTDTPLAMTYRNDGRIYKLWRGYMYIGLGDLEVCVCVGGGGQVKPNGGVTA